MNSVLKKRYNFDNILIPLIFSLLFALLAYYYVPTKGYDLYEYYSWMDKMLAFNTNDLLNYIFYRGEFVIMGYFYLIALIGNYSLAQFFPVFFIYFIMFYIIFDYGKLKNKGIKEILFVCLTFISLFKFIFAVSSFRYVLAYSIFTLGIYFEFIKNKKNIFYKLLYIIPLFIHTSSFILIFFRLILIIKNKKLIFLLLSIFCLCMFFPNLIIYCLNLFNGIQFMDFIGGRVKMYLIDESFSITLQFIFRTIQTVLITLAGLICYYKTEKKEYSQYFLFYFVIGLFTLSQITHYSIYMRFIDMLLFLSPIIIYDLLCYIKCKGKVMKFLVYSIILIFIIGGIRIQIPVFEQMYF